MSFQESDESLARFKGRIQSVIETALAKSFAATENSLRKKASQTSVDVNLDKILMDVISSELERTAIPQIEQIVRSIDTSVTTRLRSVEERMTVAHRSKASNMSLLDSKLNELESKLEQLNRMQTSLPVSAVPSHPTNPYMGIEQMVTIGDWESAFKRAVSVFNGMDFLCHILNNDKAISAEDLFSKHPVSDPLLALQMCVNLGQELAQSDKLASFKLDIINELVLGITNIHSLNLTHQFNQLKSLLIQVNTLAGAGTILSNRVKEISKILVATERLLTPANSVPNSPAPSSRYFGQSPGY